MNLEFFFDFSCPYAYLGSTQIEALAARSGANLVWKPMLLGGVFRAVGTAQNMSEGMPPGKARHNFLDMHRWASMWDVPFKLPAAHPMRTVAALRALLSIEDSSRWPAVIASIYETYWVRGENIADPLVLAAALARAALPQVAIERALAANDDPAIKDELRERTDEAIERGVFGAPAMFANGELFWGQDRLDALAAALGVAPVTQPMEPIRNGATIDFFYDFSSPFAYIASTQIERIASEAGARLRWRPFLLGALFRNVGTPNVPILAFGEAKRRYYRDDLHRQANALGIELAWNSHFPLRTVTALRLALIVGEQHVAAFTHAVFARAWTLDSPLDETALAEVLAELELDPKLIEKTHDPAVKAMLVEVGDEARARGAFGAPTTIVSWPDDRAPGDALFWGADRLELAGRAAKGWAPPLPLP